jgi:hypothetical protein
MAMAYQGKSAIQGTAAMAMAMAPSLPMVAMATATATAYQTTMATTDQVTATKSCRPTTGGMSLPLPLRNTQALLI